MPGISSRFLVTSKNVSATSSQKLWSRSDLRDIPLHCKLHCHAPYDSGQKLPAPGPPFSQSFRLVRNTPTLTLPGCNFAVLFTPSIRRSYAHRTTFCAAGGAPLRRRLGLTLDGLGLTLSSVGLKLIGFGLCSADRRCSHRRANCAPDRHRAETGLLDRVTCLRPDCSLKNRKTRRIVAAVYTE